MNRAPKTGLTISEAERAPLERRPSILHGRACGFRGFTLSPQV